MFQLLVKLSLFLCLLVCATAASNEAGAKTLFTRQTSNRIRSLQILARQRIRQLAIAPPLLKPTPKDYENLYTAIATEFAPTVNMAKYLRFSLYELLTTRVGPDGCGPWARYITKENNLYLFVNSKFKELDFHSRGNIYHDIMSLFIILF
jgi:hypothetical protein